MSVSQKGQKGLIAALIVIGLLASLGWPVSAWAEGRDDSAPTGQENEIRLGMSTALSGPVARLGRSMRRGVEIALAETNAAGGVRGRPLRLIARDDSYHPPTAARNVRRLIEEDGVLAIVGNLGTPTARVALPIARSAGVLFYGAMTGAALLRPDPPGRTVINFRASYAEEVETILNGLFASGIKPHELAFFTQDDSYGTSVFESAVSLLEAQGYERARFLPRGRYPRNTLRIEPALVSLLEATAPPKAILMVGAFAPSAKFIRLARKVFPDARFINISFVGSRQLADALGDDGEGVVVAEVVPPLTAEVPAVKAFKRAFVAHASSQAKKDPAILEGYLATRLLLKGLEAAPALTRDGVIDGLLSLGQVDMGLGAPVRLAPGHHQASHKVWLAVIRDGAFRPLDWTSLP